LDVLEVEGEDCLQRIKRSPGEENGKAHCCESAIAPERVLRAVSMECIDESETAHWDDCGLSQFLLPTNPEYEDWDEDKRGDKKSDASWLFNRCSTTCDSASVMLAAQITRN
jgi:hypothetical protein